MRSLTEIIIMFFSKRLLRLTLEHSNQGAFGLLVGKDLTEIKALSYLITSVPLSIADPLAGKLRQMKKKADFRNHLIDIPDQLPQGARWLYDAMQIWRQMKRVDT